MDVGSTIEFVQTSPLKGVKRCWSSSSSQAWTSTLTTRPNHATPSVRAHANTETGNAFPLTAGATKSSFGHGFTLAPSLSSV